MLDGEDGPSPLVDAVARREPLTVQGARLRANGKPATLSATVRRDAAGRFGGFIGDARPVQPGIATAPRPPSPALADEFITGLDRSLRRPLAQIIANADSIHSGTEGDLGSVYTDYAATIAHAGRHPLSLVDDLVDLQAVERPDFAPVSGAIDLADIARRAAGLLTVQAGGAGVVIERPLPGATLWARGDFKRADRSSSSDCTAAPDRSPLASPTAARGSHRRPMEKCSRSSSGSTPPSRGQPPWPLHRPAARAGDGGRPDAGERAGRGRALHPVATGRAVAPRGSAPALAPPAPRRDPPRGAGRA